MAVIIYNRIFWIYFMVTLFFIIIGVGLILASTDPNRLVVAILWLLGNIALLILVYHSSINWGPDGQICVIDSNSGCFDADNRVWLFVNILFIVLLIFGVLWAAEFNNKDSGPLLTISGVIIILGGLLFAGLATGWQFLNNPHIIPFWVAVVFLIIWFALTLYVAITAS